MTHPFAGSKVLVTGGTGTLGTAILRTAEKEGWDCSFTIYSRSELRQAQMRQKYSHVRYILGDVRDYERVAAAIAGHDLVIHAAAMKRLDDCDRQPDECYTINTQGSINVLRACQHHSTPRLIGISTDKACAASTAYGASKLMMERLFAASRSATTCTLVRYGNVVASNGSVIPIWRRQLAEGRPLGITDPGMTRFWMAPSAAVELVCYAAALPHGTIAVPKMGSLSLSEMASIIAPGAPQQTIGMRFAEKRHEDLVAVDEHATETVTHFLIGQGEPGRRYTSDMAKRIGTTAFLAMVEEAETYGSGSVV